MAICVATLRVHNCCWGIGHRCGVRRARLRDLGTSMDTFVDLRVFDFASRYGAVSHCVSSLVRLRACRCADSRLLFGYSTVF